MSCQPGNVRSFPTGNRYFSESRLSKFFLLSQCSTSMNVPAPAAFDGEFSRSDLEASIPDRFRKIVEKHPDRLAVKDLTASWTYSQLDHASNRIANGLMRRFGTGAETVGLMIDREGAAIAAMLGVLKCGKIYVPLDRSHPPDRLAAVIQDCQIRTLVTDTQHASLNLALPNGCTVIPEQDLGLNESPEFTHPA